MPAQIPAGTAEFVRVIGRCDDIRDQIAAARLMAATHKLLEVHDWPTDFSIGDESSEESRRLRVIALGGDFDIRGINLERTPPYISVYTTSPSRRYTVSAILPFEDPANDDRLINVADYHLARPGRGHPGAIAVQYLVRCFLPGSRPISTPRDIRRRPSRAYNEMAMSIDALRAVENVD